jgi:hypothetical protein
VEELPFDGEAEVRREDDESEERLESGDAEEERGAFFV